tara:strand:+ start:157 stop:903 length:747 start_codon:yes stop_codon:yes gene_type:complete
MNKKYIIIGAVVAVVAFFAMCGKAEAQEEVVTEKNWKLDTEVGYYDKRISGGLYGAQDSAYFKASTKLGDLQGLAFVGSLEYVNTEEFQVHSTIGTYLQTPIGGVDTRVVVHAGEEADTTFELNGAYDLNWFDFVDTSFTVAFEDGSEAGTSTDSIVTTPALNVSKTFDAKYADVTVGGEYGQSFGFDEDVEYLHGFVRFTSTINDTLPVFVQVNALRNNLGVVNDISSEGTDDDFDTSVTVGLAYSF